MAALFGTMVRRTGLVRVLLRFAHLLIVLAAGACSDGGLVNTSVPPDGPLQIELQTDQAGYPLAGSAGLRMTNRNSEIVHFGGCDDAPERQVGGRWVEVPPLNYSCPLDSGAQYRALGSACGVVLLGTRIGGRRTG